MNVSNLGQIVGKKVAKLETSHNVLDARVDSGVNSLIISKYLNWW